MPTLARRLGALRPVIQHPEFRLGAQEMAALLPGYGAWGLVTGIAMIKGGWPLWLALAMSLSVFSAGAQLAALSLMAVHTPPSIIIATAFCVNLRFVIFSVSLRPYLVHLPLWQRMAAGYFTADLSYVRFTQRMTQLGREHPAADLPTTHRPQALAYLAGSCAVNWSGWQATSIAGMLLAHVVPTHWGLEFAGVLALLGLTYSLLVDRASVLAAGIAATASVAAFALPLRLNIVAAIAMAVAAGLIFDHLRDNAPRPPRKARG
jgi:predicted branched-subunit amino acid permease